MINILGFTLRVHYHTCIVTCILVTLTFIKSKPRNLNRNRLTRVDLGCTILLLLLLYPYYKDYNKNS